MNNLSPARPASELIDAVWQARREERRDLLPALVQLLQHESPTLREEVVSLLLVRWRERSLRTLAIDVLENDDDFGVRSRAAYGLSLISSASTRQEDIGLLRILLADPNEDAYVRRACFDGLCQITGRPLPPPTEAVDLDSAATWEWC